MNSRRLATLGLPALGGGLRYDTQVLAIPNLIAYWPLTQTSGTAVVDAAGNVDDGTASGVTWADTAGPGASMGNAPLFDGVNDWIDVFSAALAALIDSDGELAISAWLKIAAGTWTDNTQRNVVSLWTAVTSRMSLWKADGGGGNDLLGIYSTNNLSNLDTTTTDWLHILVTFDTSNVTIYGDNVAQTPAAYTATNFTIVRARLGQYGGGGSYFKGHMAHVALIGRVPTAAERLILSTAV